MCYVEKMGFQVDKYKKFYVIKKKKNKFEIIFKDMRRRSL